MKQIYNTAQPPVIYRTNKLNYVWNYLGSTLKTFARVICPFLREINCFNLPIDVTSSELARLGKNSLLKPGATYRVSDYRAVNWVNGLDQALQNNNANFIPGYNPRAVHVSDETDIILIKAITENRFDTVAHSEKHPMDVLNYDPYVQSLATYLTIQNGALLPNGNTVSNFNLQWDSELEQAYFDLPAGYPVEFGAVLDIFLSFDGLTKFLDSTYEIIYPGKNDGPFAYTNAYGLTNKNIAADVTSSGERVYLPGITNAEYLLYDSDSLNIQIAGNKGSDAYGFVRRRTCTINNISLGCDWRYEKFRRYEVDLSTDYGLETDYYAIGDSFVRSNAITTLNPSLYTGSYKDFKVIPDNQVSIRDFHITSDGRVDILTNINGDIIGCNNVVIYPDTISGFFVNLYIKNAVINSGAYNLSLRSKIIDVTFNAGLSNFAAMTKSGDLDSAIFNVYCNTNMYQSYVTYMKQYQIVMNNFNNLNFFSNPYSTNLENSATSKLISGGPSSQPFLTTFSTSAPYISVIQVY